MARRDLDFLWKEKFMDSSQFPDRRNRKRGPRSPEFRPKQTREPLRVDGWLKEEMRRSGVQDEEFRKDGMLKVHMEFQDRTALLDLMKVCGKQKDLRTGSSIHTHILERGLLRKDITLGNALLSMYAKCGALAKAQATFDQLPARNVVSWNALIAGYSKHGLGNEALSCFRRMRDEGLSPDIVTFICVLKACGSIGEVGKGEDVHAEVHMQGLLEKDIVLGTALVDMYAKCGALAKAQGVFNNLPAQDVVTWNALIAGYAQHGLCDEVLSCFGQMRDKGLSPDAVTFACILKACGSIGAVDKGEEIHVEVSRQGLLEQDTVLGNALVDMYAKCGALAKAQGVFAKLPARDIVTWNSLIAGYAQHGLGHEALSLFARMQDEGFSPNVVTFVCILKACGSIGAGEKGEEIHDEVSRQGLLEKHNVLGTALVDMYAKCGILAKAQGVFDKLPARNVVTWNALIAGYAQNGFGEEALHCFAWMQDESLSPDAVTFILILKACGSTGALEKGEDIHAEVGRQGLLGKDNVLGTALVDMYVKCGALSKARGVFDKLSAPDVAAWTALIAGYSQHGYGEEALSCFGQMRNDGIPLDTVTIVCILKACGSIGAAEKGKKIHAEVSRQGLLEKDEALGTALVDMYAKCGALTKAQQVFDELPVRGLAIWTALIAGYAQAGKVTIVFGLFMKMIGEGIEPDGVTFVVLLTACSHAGLVEEGQMYFDSMSAVYCIVPTLEHRTCMVDIFGRAGCVEKAISEIEKVPPSDCLLLWSSLMGACQKQVNVELGRWVFEHAVQLDKKYAGAYVCMSNVYATAGMQEELNAVEALRTKNGGWKIPEHCWWTDDCTFI